LCNCLDTWSTSQHLFLIEQLFSGSVTPSRIRLAHPRQDFLPALRRSDPRHPTSRALVLLAQYTVRLLSDVSRLNEDNYTQTAMDWIQEQFLFGKTYNLRVLMRATRLNEDNYTQTAMDWIQEQFLFGKTYNLRVFNARDSPSNSKLL
jgi:hypothetical protein